MITKRISPVVLLFIWISCASATMSTPHLAEITLTSAEKQWLEKQEELRFSMTDNQNPVAFQNHNGDMDGIIPEYMKIVEDVIGKKIRVIPVSDDPVTVSNRSTEMRLHGILAIFKNEITQNLFLFSEPYFQTPLYVFSTKNNRESLQNISDLRSKKIAVLKGHQMMNAYADTIEGVEKIVVENPKKQMELLQYGEVDAVLGYMTYHHLIREFMFDNIIPAYSSNNVHDIYLGILPEYPLLRSILNKAILNIPSSRMQGIVEKWLHYSTMDEIDGLSANEQLWIKERHTVRARVSYWPPYMFPSPEPSGMAVDYLKFVAERYGINVEFVPDVLGWKASLEDLKNSREYYDLILTMNPTLERGKIFALSEPYLKIPWVIFTQKNSSFISSVNDLNGKIVSIESGYSMQKKLQTLYPKIYLNEVDTSLAALEAVSTGDADAYIGNLANATFIIQEHGLSNIKIAAPTPFERHTQSMATRADWSELASIITKGVNLMTQKEHDDIKNKWLSVRYEHGLRLFDILKWVGVVIGISLIILGVILFWNRRLKIEISARQKIEKKLRISENQYRTLSDAAFEGIIILRNDLLIQANAAFAKMVGEQQKSLIGNNVLDLVSKEEKDNVAQKISEDSNIVYESMFLKKDGSSFPVEIQTKQFFYMGEKVKVIAIQDVSQKKQSEAEIKELRGLLPICSSCKKIRDDKGYWNQLENFIEERTGVLFSHGMCTECSDKLYGHEDWYIKMKKKNNK